VYRFTDSTPFITIPPANRVVALLQGNHLYTKKSKMTKVDRQMKSQSQILATVDERSEEDNPSAICCFTISRRLRSLDGKDERRNDIPMRQEITRSASLPSNCMKTTKRYDSLEDVRGRHSLLSRALLLLCKLPREHLHDSLDDWSITPKLQDQEEGQSEIELHSMYKVQEIEEITPPPNLDNLMFMPFQPDVEYSCSEWIPQMKDYPNSFEMLNSSNSDFLLSCPTGQCVTFPSFSVATIDEISVLTGEEERHALDNSDPSLRSSRRGIDSESSSARLIQNDAVEPHANPSFADWMEQLTLQTKNDSSGGCWDLSDVSGLKRVGSPSSIKVSSRSGSIHTAVRPSSESPRSVISEGDGTNEIRPSWSPEGEGGFGCWNLRENIFEQEYFSYPEVLDGQTTPKAFSYRKTGRLLPVQVSKNIHPSASSSTKDLFDGRLPTCYGPQDSGNM
jgi:hypothetical protein